MFDIVSIVKAAGYLGVAAIVFAESGLLIGVVLPGDSLLFTAGFLASQGFLHIVPLILVAFISAVIGDNCGYWLGKRFGPSIFTRPDSLLFNRAYISRAEQFYAHYGAKTIVLARFMPVIRTIAPVLAGVGTMEYSLFLTYNIIGGAIWALGLPLAGYWLGNTIPNVDHYLLPIIVAIIFASIAPGLIHFLRDAENRQLVLRQLRKLFS